MTRNFDVIVFGASGFSGQYVVEEFQNMLVKEGKNLNWGVAGRSKKKLEEVLKNLGEKNNQDFSNIPCFEADTTNEKSLLFLASQTRLLVNCTGPYKFHGEPVIQACIQQKCHYIDITAEVTFMEKVQLLYHEEAKKSGIYIVTSCGIDNIPADIGLDFVQKNFDGTLNSVEMYMELEPEKGYGRGVIMNYGTWESMIHFLRDSKKLKDIRNKIFEGNTEELKPKLNMRYLHRIPYSTHFAGPYPGGEGPVMRRSQHYFHQVKNSRPIQIHTYCGSTKFWHYILLFIGFIWLKLFLKFQFTTNLFLKHPKFFSMNMIGRNPSKEQISKLGVTTTFYGKGWKGKKVDEKFKEVEDSWIVAKLEMKDPYVVTGVCAAAAILVTLDDRQKVPGEGGVYTTAGFFTDTNLIGVLERNGLEFKVVGQGSL